MATGSGNPCAGGLGAPTHAPGRDMRRVIQFGTSSAPLHSPDPTEVPHAASHRRSPVLGMTSELGKVMAAAKAREARGERVLHLERGEPDFDTPPHIVEALDGRGARGRDALPRRARHAAAAHGARREARARERDRVRARRRRRDARRNARAVLRVPGAARRGRRVARAVAALDGDSQAGRVLSRRSYRTMPAYLEILEGRWTPADFARASARRRSGPRRAAST